MSQSTYRQPGESPAATPPSGMLVSHTPVAMAQRAARFRAMLIRRTIGLGISALISVAWWLLFRPEPWSFLFCLLVGSVLYSLVWVIVNFVQLKWARKVTSRVPLGPAFQIDTHGIVLATRAEGERIGWPEVNLVAGRNKLFDPGPD